MVTTALSRSLVTGAKPSSLKSKQPAKAGLLCGAPGEITDYVHVIRPAGRSCVRSNLLPAILSNQESEPNSPAAPYKKTRKSGFVVWRAWRDYGLHPCNPPCGPRCVRSNLFLTNLSNQASEPNSPATPYKKTRKSGFVYMARLERFELPTARFVAEYSIQLSYRRIFCKGAQLCVFVIVASISFIAGATPKPRSPQSTYEWAQKYLGPFISRWLRARDYKIHPCILPCGPSAKNADVQNRSRRF